MTTLVETIQKIALGVIESRKPTELLFGTVVSANPMQVKLSQKQVLDESFLLFLAPPQCSRETCAISCRYAVGDVLVLLRFPGGQRFLVLGRKGGA